MVISTILFVKILSYSIKICSTAFFFEFHDLNLQISFLNRCLFWKWNQPYNLWNSSIFVVTCFFWFKNTQIFITMKHIFLCIFLMSLLLNTSCGSRQQRQAESDSQSISTSISNQNVNTIAEDASGYIWLGTFRGLNRYNGNERTHQKDQN